MTNHNSNIRIAQTPTKFTNFNSINLDKFLLLSSAQHYCYAKYKTLTLSTTIYLIDKSHRLQIS